MSDTALLVNTVFATDVWMVDIQSIAVPAILYVKYVVEYIIHFYADVPIGLN